MQTVLDFVVPDVCYSCGVDAMSRGGQSELPRLPIPSGYFATSTLISFLGLVSVVNHPFCRSCLSRLEPSLRPSRIGVGGVSSGMGWVKTATGDIFTFRPHDAAGAVPGTPRLHGESIPLVACSPFEMNDTSLEIIRLIKFQARRSLVSLAAAAMAYALQTQIGRDRGTALVPVPMHPSATRRRGFNQADLLATDISRVAGIPVFRNALRKIARTQRQSQTDRDKRAGNVRGAFRWAGGDLSGRHVCLVDDLVTTGATAASCASVLLAAGARRVTSVCLAKAL